METTYLKTLTTAQNIELASISAELKKLAEKLQAFRKTNGDNAGCVDQAASFVRAASQNVEELVVLSQPSRLRFTGRSGR